MFNWLLSHLARESLLTSESVSQGELTDVILKMFIEGLQTKDRIKQNACVETNL
jgi:hypothetical protein